MPIITTVTVAACAGCCGSGEPFLVWRCQSLTGTASLCGLSGYSSDAAPYNAGDPENWEGQYRKWRTRTLGGGMTGTSYVDVDCTGDVACYSGPPTAHADTSTTWSGTVTVDCTGYAAFGESVATIASNFDCDPVVVTTPREQVATDLPESAGFYPVSRTLTTRIYTGPGCIAETRPFAGRASFDLQGAAMETLSDEVYLYDVLAEVLEGDPEADVVAGEECCATLTDAGLTAPEDASPISLTGTAARARIFVFGDPLTEYNVAVTLTRGEEERIVLIGADGMVPTYYYPPFAPPDTDPWCVTAVALYTP